MSELKSPQNEEELLKAIIDLLSDVEAEADEDIDEELRELGYNPEEIAARMKRAADRALAQSPLNWRNQAESEMERERRRLAGFIQSVVRSRKELIDAITALTNRLGVAQGRVAAGVKKSRQRKK